MEKVIITGQDLTIDQIAAVCRDHAFVELSEESKKKILESRKVVDELLEEQKTVYGITTGFGKFSDVVITRKQCKHLQENLIITHSVGAGDPFPEDVARGMLLLRTNNLSKGFSGIRLETVQTMIDMLNKGVTPFIPEKGSLGASGDLAPLSHMVMVMIGRGKAWYQGELRVQDAYSLRCTPQIHGASKDAINYVKEHVDIEINSVTDNPLIFKEDRAGISGGNFHGQPMALPFDFLKIAEAELANVSERRIERLVNPAYSGLPAFLTEHGGVNSGFMIVQYSAAALVSENKVLAHPASVDSIPSSAGQEDHVSMGTIAARQAAEIGRNVRRVLAMELMVACQGIDMRGNKGLGKGTQVAYDLVRKGVAKLEYDRPLYEDIEYCEQLLKDDSLINAVEAAIGGELEL